MEGTFLSNTALNITDIGVIIAYFIFILIFGIYFSRTSQTNAGGYFLAGKNMNWMPIGASLFASNVGSIHFVGLAGSGAAAGIAVGLFELNAMFVLLLLGYIFLPVYLSAGVYTMPEYLKLRFGGRRLQICMAFLTLMVYIFTKISADLYAGALFIEQALKWDLYLSLMLVLGMACVFTIAGGLSTVIWTDFLQTFIMLAGAIFLMIMSFIKVGGFTAMVEKYPYAIPNTTLMDNTTQCGYPRKDYMHLFHSPHADDIPGPGIIGLTINSIWYWCSDQVIVQRALAAKSYDHSKAATIFCGYLKILPLFLLVFPGMIARILFKDTVGCADVDACYEICGGPACSNIAYPSLVINLMPEGARGLMLAAMVSALITSLTSIFNSSSTIFALDIWMFFRKKATEVEVLIVGRIFILILVIISVVWIPIIQASQGGDLFIYIQVISSFTQPPICAIYLLALFWGRLNEKGAFWSVLIGIAAGMIRFGVEYYQKIPNCSENLPDPRPDFVKNFHFLYFSCFLFLLTTFIAVVISLLTEPIDRRCLVRLTWWTRNSKEPRLDIDDMTLSKATSSAPSVVYQKDKEKNELFEMDDKETLESKSKTSHEPAKKKADISGQVSASEHVNYALPKQAFNQCEDVIYTIDVAAGSSPPSCGKKFLYRICGFDKTYQPTTITNLQEQRSIEEDPKWKWPSNILSIILAGISIFITIYFA